MKHEQPFSLDVEQAVVHGLFQAPARSGRFPTAVICHGFKGFMEWGFFPYLADLLVDRGYCALRFNFSGSGMHPGDELVTDPEAFRTATFSKDLHELRAVIDSIGRTVASDCADPERIALVGHSRGGGTALLAAADRAEVRALVTWAAVATFDRMPPAEREHWQASGEIPVVNARTGQKLAIGREVLEDLEANGNELDLQSAAARRKAPWLIVHGADDETVPVSEAELLHEAATIPSDLHVIPGASHTFGVGHPFRRPSPQLIEAMNATQSWLRRYLPARLD